MTREYQKLSMTLMLLPAMVLMAVTAPAMAAKKGCHAETHPLVIRALVIGGMAQTTDTWQAIVEMFEEETNYTVELVKTGNVFVIDPLFRAGMADLLTQHSADITTDLVADGYGVNIRPWAHNEHVIMGPASDPAGIAGMTDAVEAFKKIAAAGKQGNVLFVDLWGAGKREVARHLANKAGIYPPSGGWMVVDASPDSRNQLFYVASLGNAYSLFGRAPVISGRQDPAGLEIMVGGGPDLQRPFMVMAANPEKFPCTNVIGAKKLSEFLLSKQVQEFLPTYLVDDFGGEPPFQPLRLDAFNDTQD